MYSLIGLHLKLARRAPKTPRKFREAFRARFRGFKSSPTGLDCTRVHTVNGVNPSTSAQLFDYLTLFYLCVFKSTQAHGANQFHLSIQHNIYIANILRPHESVICPSRK